MPRLQARQQTGQESQESLCGESVPVNGADRQAARRAHMRSLTMARQAAESRHRYPPIPLGSPDRQIQLAARAAELREDLARINAEHQTWLHNHGEVR